MNKQGNIFITNLIIKAMTNKESNKKWSGLLHYGYSRQTPYWAWLTEFCQQYQDEPSSAFLDKLLASSEYRLYVKHVEVKALKNIAFWVRFWGWIMIIGVVLAVMFG